MVPVVKGRSSIAGRLSVRDSYDANPIIATGAPTTFPALVNAERERFEGEVRVEHALTSTQTLRGEYQRWDSMGDNLGVGEFELPERAFSEDIVRRHRAPLGHRHHWPALPQRVAPRVRRHAEQRRLAQRRRGAERAQRVQGRRRPANRRPARSGDRDRADRRPDQQQASQGQVRVRDRAWLDPHRSHGQLRRHLHVRQPGRLQRRSPATVHAPHR